MSYDSNLELQTATVSGNGSSTAINVEGGMAAWLVFEVGVDDTLTSLNSVLEFQADGSNWHTCPGGRLRPILPGDVPAAAYAKFTVPVFIPEHVTKGALTPIRLTHTIVGTSVDVRARLEPMIPHPNPVPTDKLQREGVYIDVESSLA
jgi:hypothetical protein